MGLLESLQEIHDAHGELSADLVVTVASDPEHPLHGRFEWDDTAAAHQYRLAQASGLIRSVHIRREIAEGRTIKIRAFVSRQELDGNPEDAQPVGHYLPVEEVLQSDLLATAWFRSLERDWKALKRRAGDCKEFAAMVAADIDQVA